MLRERTKNVWLRRMVKSLGALKLETIITGHTSSVVDLSIATAGKPCRDGKR